jgi:hypothetical protein
MLRCLAAVAILWVAGSAATEQSGSAVYRYRAAIAALLQLKPGMIAAEVGATPNVIAPEMAPQVTATGRVIGATLDRRTGAIGLDPLSVDAVALIEALTVVEQTKALFGAIATALKPGGVLLVVDVPQENDGKHVSGLDADDVVSLAAANGLKREAESGIVPGHYAIRFRKS